MFEDLRKGAERRAEKAQQNEAAAVLHRAALNLVLRIEIDPKSSERLRASARAYQSETYWQYGFTYSDLPVLKERRKK